MGNREVNEPMKFKVNLKNKEVNFEADVEQLVEKSLERKDKNPNRKTAYQIRQEEKRKNEELKHKQQMQSLYLLIGLVVFLAIFGIVVSILGI